MSDKTNGDGNKGRGGRPGKGRSGRPSGERPQRRSGARAFEGSGRGEGERNAKRPFRAKGGGVEGGNERGPDRKHEDGRKEGERKPFRPRSHGMLSHGTPREEGDKPARPKSYGRLSHESVRTERRPGFKRDADRPPRPDRHKEPSAAEPAGAMRIAKRLARAGIASRRDAEGMIADGRVKVNGKRLDSPAVTVSERDQIEVDGAVLPAIERTRLWLFHKPQGLVTTTRDPEGRATVFDRLPSDMPRVLSVGRLDINTEGLLLLTNDGGLARILELPSTGWLRRYRVRAHGSVRQEQLDALRDGIAVDGVFYGAIEASLDREQGSNVWLTIGLREGKNREVKRVLGALGLEVNRLIRLSFGPFQLGDLPEGAVQEIKGRMLRDQLGERLIEEAGANFDAPIVKSFSNAPVRQERSPEPLKKRGDWISASGEKPNRKRAGEAKRENALERLDTKAGRPPRGSERKFDRPKEDGLKRDRQDGERPPAKKPLSGRRNANVWMAPGARPQGEKKLAESKERPGSVRPPRPGRRDRIGGKGGDGRNGSGGDRPRRPRGSS